MNPKIKEALSNCIQKDAETEQICAFIADFINEYGYHLINCNTINFYSDFVAKGRKFNGKRMRYNTIFLFNPYDLSMCKEFKTTFNVETWHNILKKEGAKLNYAQPTNSLSPYRMEIKFPII